MLASGLQEQGDLELHYFDWRFALLGRYDVFHVHWPDVMIGGRSGWQPWVRRAAFVLLLVRLALFRTPVVRTVHNLSPHESSARSTATLLRWLDRRVRGQILLNEIGAPDEVATDRISRRPVLRTVILLGHYQDWFADPGESIRREIGTVGYFGQIREYKNVSALIRAFRRLDADDVRLVVAGRPAPAPLGDLIRREVAADPRIDLRLQHIPDADLVELVRRSQLIALPFEELYNSSSVLLALSLDRPVLVPAGQGATLLAKEMGEQWIRTFTPPLSVDDLESALATTREIDWSARPDLSRRGWQSAAADHTAFYRKVAASR